MGLLVVTGSIGAGKSRVSAFLAKRNNWPLIRCDEIAAQLLAKEAAGWVALKKLAPVFFARTGEVDRSALRQAIFNDARFRAELDNLIHPLVLAKLEQQVKELVVNQQHILIEVPLLVEAGWQDRFDTVICVYCQPAIALDRLCQRDSCSRQQALAAFNSQEAIDKKIAVAHHVIDNSASWALTIIQLLHLGEVLGQISE